MLGTIFIALIIALIPLIFFFVIPFFYSGIHYEKTTKLKIKTITKLLHNQLTNSQANNLKVCDLGSGDGDILISLAKSPITKHQSPITKFTGFEINPFLISASKYKIKKQKLKHLIKIKQKNFWKQKLTEFDIIIIFQFGTFMKKLENKIKKECKKGTIIISNHWKLPNFEPIKKENDIYLYKL